MACRQERFRNPVWRDSTQGSDRKCHGAQKEKMSTCQIKGSVWAKGEPWGSVHRPIQMSSWGMMARQQWKEMAMGESSKAK